MAALIHLVKAVSGVAAPRIHLVRAVSGAQKNAQIHLVRAVSGVVGAVQITLGPAQQAAAFAQVNVSAVVITPGAPPPDSWSATITPDPGSPVATLIGAGSTRSFRAPGTYAGARYTVTMTAYFAGKPDSTNTVVVTVARYPGLYTINGVGLEIV